MLQHRYITEQMNVNLCGLKSKQYSWI